MAKRSESSGRRGRTAGKPQRTRRPSAIDYSDIPELSGPQLQGMRRVGRPPLGDRARQLVAIRLDADVLIRFRKEASRRNIGYQTLINEVLAKFARGYGASG